MSLHYLAPRRASDPTAKPDVLVAQHGSFFRWRLKRPTDKPGGPFAPWSEHHMTEFAALAAARHAAGFGHVAAQACETPCYDRLANGAPDQCRVCEWSRDAHATVQS